MVKIFLTGASGFIGGEALYNLYHASALRPSITALVRNIDHEARIHKAYPGIRIVRGDLDALDVIEKEARQSDVVFHLASTKHAASSQAISRGLAGRSSPGHWIQMSGASLFSGAEVQAGTYGSARSEVYNDVEHSSSIHSIIRANSSREVDNLVLNQDSDKIKTALVIGPLIYGTGRGPINQRSIQLPEMARTTLSLGQGFQVGDGNSVWSNVHIHDLGLLFRLFLDAIVSNKEGCWNQQGVYFAENGKLAFGTIGRAMADEAEALGAQISSHVKSITKEQADQATPHGAVLWGTTAVGVGARAREQLGWRPVHDDLLSTLPGVMRGETKRSSMSRL